MRQKRRLAGEPLEDAAAAFRSARFRFAEEQLQRRLLGGSAHVDARMLLARVQLRRGDPAGALATLTACARNGAREAKAEIAMLKGIAFSRLGDAASARAQFRNASAMLRRPDPLHGELTYHMAAGEWIERRLDRAQKLLASIPEDRDADLDLHVSILRGAIASANENLPEQGAILLEALRKLRNPGVAEVYLYGMLVTHIASLAEELSGTELRDAAVAHVDRVPWTEDIADLHFHAVRAIAWRHALEGDEFSAFRRLKEALATANSDAWRVAALTDRAYLAGALGEKRWAAQELRDAHELASTIDWNAVPGEEKLALPVLAELFAERDPAVAIAYVTTFRNVGKNYPRILSSRRDRRVEALESYSLGRVQLALGEAREAKRLLSNAWSIYRDFGMLWRAARAALALAQIDDASTWQERAKGALAAYPRSWLARGTGVQATRSPQELAPGTPLTPAQGAVLDLLLEGRSTEDIANSLGRSTFTVRNHIKAIFKAYKVSSRSALIVRATRG
jgi:DNA-binding CsgD family transcriptional regulator/predicted negative regulator of RcsB-dependent stress response